MKKVESYIEDWCNQILGLTEKEKVIIEFGLTMIGDSLVKTLGILIIGALCSRFWEFAIALVTFSGLRYWAGGRHCRTEIGCFCSMTVICGGAVMGANILEYVRIQRIYIGLLVIFLMLAVYAPYQSKNLITKKQEYRRRKKIGACMFCIIVGVFIALIQNCYVGRLILISMVCEVMSILPVKSRRRSAYDE